MRVETSSSYRQTNLVSGFVLAVEGAGAWAAINKAAVKNISNFPEIRPTTLTLIYQRDGTIGQFFDERLDSARITPRKAWISRLDHRGLVRIVRSVFLVASTRLGGKK